MAGRGQFHSNVLYTVFFIRFHTATMSLDPILWLQDGNASKAVALVAQFVCTVIGKI